MDSPLGDGSRQPPQHSPHPLVSAMYNQQSRYYNIIVKYFNLQARQTKSKIIYILFICIY